MVCSECHRVVTDPGMAVIRAFVPMGGNPPEPFGFAIVHKLVCGDGSPPGTREWSWEARAFPDRLEEVERTLARYGHRDASWARLRAVLASDRQ